jgi:hypothetical protein
MIVVSRKLEKITKKSLASSFTPALHRQGFVLVLFRSTVTFLPKLNYFD